MPNIVWLLGVEEGVSSRAKHINEQVMQVLEGKFEFTWAVLTTLRTERLVLILHIP